jgi:hypothetical protein
MLPLLLLLSLLLLLLLSLLSLLLLLLPPQARNNARVGVSGSLDMFSNAFFDAPVTVASTKQTYVGGLSWGLCGGVGGGGDGQCVWEGGELQLLTSCPSKCLLPTPPLTVVQHRQYSQNSQHTKKWVDSVKCASGYVLTREVHSCVCVHKHALQGRTECMHARGRT